MDRVDQLSQKQGQSVILKGWIYNSRCSGKIIFLQFRDGSGFVQLIGEQDKVPASVWKEALNLPMESSVEIEGRVTKHPHKEEYEIQLSGLKILHRAEDYPISKKEHGPDFLLDRRHLWLRSKTQWAMMRLRHFVFMGIVHFMEKENCIRVDTPILTPTSCEDTSELFSIDYFGVPGYLAQSGQLYLEAAEQSVGRCYDFSPAFRAEKSKTRKHLTEFWMMDVELPFEDQAQMEIFQENMITYVIKYVLERCNQELTILERDISLLERIKPPFPKISHREAIDLLREKGIEKDYDQDLTGAEETELSKLFERPVIVKNYPFDVKAFYMKQMVDEFGMKRAVCNDMLLPEGYGEIIGGSQREEDYQKLLQVMKEKNYRIEDYEWYLDLRRYGTQIHSGFGLGLERLVLFISGRKHIRETIAFPRMLHRLTP